MIPNISRYLGIGTELSFAALKNQIPKTLWYGGETFPVIDMKWIAKQYYHEFMRYASLPSNQGMVDKMFVTSADYWKARIEKTSYLTAEDESYNLFETLREFSTRALSQGFVNVISTNYILRDYMAKNSELFKTDPKAVANLAADFSKTNRNVALSMILMMSNHPVSEDALLDEMSLIGLKIFDLRKQFWYEIYRCFSSAKENENLPQDYREAIEAVSLKKISKNGEEFGCEVLKERTRYNFIKGRDEKCYEITNPRFIQAFVSDLKSALYVAEDEYEKDNYLGNEIVSHIYQKVLPGQFLTIAGKYYQMNNVSARNEIIIKRASEYIDNRNEYRQIRHYHIDRVSRSGKANEYRKVNDTVISFEYADFDVTTKGYYETVRYDDMKNARLFTYDSEKSIPTREYLNKRILRIQLPKDKCSDEIRFTLTLLMNEIFKTLFAENKPYVSALTSFNIKAEKNPQTYTIDGEKGSFDSDSIYVIEDSQLDLGLLETVERNIDRIFGIIYDYLDWLLTTEQRVKELAETNYDIEPAKEDTLTIKSPTYLRRVTYFTGNPIRDIKKIFVSSDNSTVNDDVYYYDTSDWFSWKTGVIWWPYNLLKWGLELVTYPFRFLFNLVRPASVSGDVFLTDYNDDSDAFYRYVRNDAAVTQPSVTVTEETVSEPVKTVTEEVITEGTEETVTVTTEDNKETFTVKPVEIISAEQKKIFESTYLFYGYDMIPDYIKTEETYSYLKNCNYEFNPLTKARKGRSLTEQLAREFDDASSRHCDFCGREISGIEYEAVSDGRIRCMTCSRTTVKSVEEFRELFEEVRRNMEYFFGISLNADLRIELASADTIARRLKNPLVPSVQKNPNVAIGIVRDRKGFTMLFENSLPRMQVVLGIVYELTHLWQYLNWNKGSITLNYGTIRKELYDGMAMWATVQYAFLINETGIANREELMVLNESSARSRGYRRFKKNYPITEDTVLVGPTPFFDKAKPLDKSCCGKIKDYNLPQLETTETK